MCRMFVPRLEGVPGVEVVGVPEPARPSRPSHLTAHAPSPCFVCDRHHRAVACVGPKQIHPAMSVPGQVRRRRLPSVPLLNMQGQLSIIIKSIRFCLKTSEPLAVRCPQANCKNKAEGQHCYHEDAWRLRSALACIHALCLTNPPPMQTAESACRRPARGPCF